MQCYLAWLVYFYVSMALRECVLLVNGSHIRPWWIQHHYWSAGSSLVMLALPISSPSACAMRQGWWAGVGNSLLRAPCPRLCECLLCKSPNPAQRPHLAHQPCTALPRISCYGAASKHW